MRSKTDRKKLKRANPGGSGNAQEISASVQAAKVAGLRYVSHQSPGIRRRRRGKQFAYVLPNGKPLHDADTLMRIKALVIPPAWEDVWICASEQGHIQAIGRDARGRKQYRYHPRFRATQDENKYARMLEFVHALPRIRRRVGRDLRRRGLPREKVLAAIVRLLETTLIRVGNKEYAQQNHSYGLTTIRNRHADVHGSKIHFHFRGKSGVQHAIDLNDARIAKIIRRCQDLPGEELFGFEDEAGEVHQIGSENVNDYLRDASGQDFTAKDFRTWAGTVLAAKALQEFEAFDSKAQAKKNIVRAVEEVAKKLGNTKAVCRKCYIHPAIIDSYLDGTLIKTLHRRAARIETPLAQLPAEEAAVLVLLQRRLTAEQKIKKN